MIVHLAIRSDKNLLHSCIRVRRNIYNILAIRVSNGRLLYHIHGQSQRTYHNLTAGSFNTGAFALGVIELTSGRMLRSTVLAYDADFLQTVNVQ